MREERLRTTAHLRGLPALAMSAWRGPSGKRYVVSVHPLDHEFDGSDFGDCVVLAVSRDSGGIAHLLAVSSCADSISRSQVAGFRKRGATELHVHRLADGEDARTAIVSDLQP